MTYEVANNGSVGTSPRKAFELTEICARRWQFGAFNLWEKGSSQSRSMRLDGGERCGRDASHRLVLWLNAVRISFHVLLFVSRKFSCLSHLLACVWTDNGNALSKRWNSPRNYAICEWYFDKKLFVNHLGLFPSSLQCWVCNSMSDCSWGKRSLLCMSNCKRENK